MSIQPHAKLYELTNCLIPDTFYSNYDRYYEPHEYWTVRNYSTPILIYERNVDTLSVYMPHVANIPKGLANINEIVSLWSCVFD